jgi:uncharacterized protein
MRRFDLRSLRFGDESETWRRLTVEVDPFTFGGLEYGLPDGRVDALLTAARVGDRLTLSLELETQLSGPCQRCLADAGIAVAPRGIEYVRHGDSEGDQDDEGYARAHQLDVERWARDLIADDLPQRLLCRPDCRGLCAVCGADLNAEPGPRHTDEESADL